MSERGQKIFQWCVWIVIIALVALKIISIVKPFNKQDTTPTEEYISQNEWNEMLAEGFDNRNIHITLDEPAENVTGRYAALSSMYALNDRIGALTDEENPDDDAKIALATEYNIVSTEQLDKNLTQDEADDILNNALGIYFDPQYYPEYFEVETKQDVINGDEWEISSFDEESQVIVANFDENIPEAGQVMMYTNDYGIAQARYVDSITQDSTGAYTVQLRNVEDVSEIFDSISFSGTTDFSYLAGGGGNGGNGGDGQPGNEGGEESASAGHNPFVMTAYAAELDDSIMLAEWEWFEDKTALKKESNTADSACDIEINVGITDTVKNGKETAKVTAYIEVTSDGVTKKYKFSVDDEGKTSFSETVSAEGFKFEFSENDKKGFSSDTSYMKDEFGVTANVKLTNFSVCTSGYYQWADPDDPKNYVEVLASADKVNINSSAKLSSEDKYKIATLPLPIAATAGTISINLNVYLVVSASGELTLWYELDNPYTGINISTANGLTHPHGHGYEDAGVRAKVELSGGLIGEAAVMVLDTIDLANPGIDVRVYGSASTVDVKDDYEYKTEYIGVPCYELKAQGPIIKLTATAGEDSLLYALLDTLKVEATYDLIKKDGDNVPWMVTYHVEENTDGTVTVTMLEDEQKHDDVCTHIQLKEPEVPDVAGDLEDAVNDKIDEKKEEVEEEINNALEDALEKWLEENCGDCF